METELKVLKNIFKAKDKTSVKLISNRLGYGLDYLRFICKKLEERDLIKRFSRDWYKITLKGQKELEKRGLIKKSFPKKGVKMKTATWKAVRMKSLPVISKNIKLKSKLAKTREEKLKIGKKIEKAASFLRKLKIF